MTIQEVTELLAPLRSRVSRRTLEAINAILALARAYDYLGDTFRFDAAGDIDAQVNQILIELSDAIYEDTRNNIARVTEDEDRDAVLFTLGWDIERVDYHASRLKLLLEAYFANGFAKKMTNSDLMKDVLFFLTNPNGYLGADLFSFGKGISMNPIDSFTLTEQYNIMKAWQRQSLQTYAKNPDIIGYRVRRGSDFNCPQCDDLTIGIHPVSEQVLPAHVRCMCYTEPVYAGEIQ